MQKLKRFFLSLFFFVAFCVLGLIVGVGVGYGVAVLSNEGFFTYWQLLDGSIEFEHIEEATSQIVWGRATDGKLYSWYSNCYREENCKKWIRANGIPDDIHDWGERDMEKGDSCKPHYYSFLREPPGNVIECARAWFAGPEFGTVVYYALLEDGKIWVWHHSGSMIFDLIVPIFFAFFGLVVGIITFIVFVVRQARKSKMDSASTV